MNAEQAEALFRAEKEGVRQIRGRNYDYNGGHCAIGVLEKAGFDCLASFSDHCPLCGTQERGDADGILIRIEADLVVHLNDVHKMTFSEIARKLGPDSV